MKNWSIRLKLVLWFSLVLIVIVAITLLSALAASQMVLVGTIRDYLIGTVEENVDNIQFVPNRGDASANLYIPLAGGYLEIDRDFMKVVNDVHTALYTADGAMLYGENPLSRRTDSIPFTQSRAWQMKIRDVRYDLYDRKLNIDLPDGQALWIRGVVPETESEAQLGKIIRLSLLFLPFVILLSVLSGYLLAGRLLSPIRRIERTAERISRGDDLKQRIDVGDNRDEVGRMAAVFNRMFDRLEQAFETERRFTSDASHELRTPTSVILAQAEYTLERERPTEEYIEALEVIQKQGRRMDALVRDMLDYTRMEQNAERYALEPLDLSQLVRETCAPMSLIGANRITLCADIEEGITLRGNPTLLSRLVQNLVDNAYRYGREDGHIDVTLRREGERVVLSVRDDGIGIPPQEQEKIFDRFYRSDHSRTERGTGLGLSMVRRIAALHGARVELDSEVGCGSDFKIIFEGATL